MQEGGPIALLRDGDAIVIDATKRQINVLLKHDQLEARRKEWKAPPLKVRLSLSVPLVKYRSCKCFYGASLFSAVHWPYHTDMHLQCVSSQCIGLITLKCSYGAFLVSTLGKCRSSSSRFSNSCLANWFPWHTNTQRCGLVSALAVYYSAKCLYALLSGNVHAFVSVSAIGCMPLSQVLSQTLV